MTEDLTMRCPECKDSRTILRNNGDPAKAVAVEVVCLKCDDGDRMVPRYFDADGKEIGWEDDRAKPDINPDIWLDAAAAFGPVLKEAFPYSEPAYRAAVGEALAEQVKTRAHWFWPVAPDIAGDEAFCATVWEALKGDHNDLRRQQIILNAHRAAKPDISTYLDRAEETGALTVTIAELREFIGREHDLSWDAIEARVNVAELDDPVEATPAEQIGDFINRIVELAPKAGLHVGITVRPLGRTSE